MKFRANCDLHIHTYLSPCSSNPEQNADRILRYAEENGLHTVCVADHFWDENVPTPPGWYVTQTFSRLSEIKPLPQSDGVRFLFGCETELDQNLTLGISKERCGEFDFVVIPLTHFHLRGLSVSHEDMATPQSRADTWVKRFDAVLGMDLPFHKIGLAHLTISHIAPTHEEHIEVLRLLPEEEMVRLFTKAASLGVGIELNCGDLGNEDIQPHEEDLLFRPYRIAKECGCRFYCGSDAHSPEDFARAKGVFERAAEKLELTREHEFVAGL